MTDVISTDQVFSPGTRAKLARLAGAMIPAVDSHPAGDHPEILAALIDKLGVQAELANEGLEALDRLALDSQGSDIAALNDSQCLSLLPALQEQAPGFYQLLQASLLTCYYQNPAVLAAIGVAPHAPFPAGRDVHETDWSLLDPVRGRQPFYREV